MAKNKKATDMTPEELNEWLASLPAPKDDLTCMPISDPDPYFKMEHTPREQEQEELRAKIEMLENEIQNQEDQAENVDRFIRQAKKYLYLEKLTPTILNDMVNAVYVHAPAKSSGHRVQDVTISYNYIGILPANLLYDIMNGKAA